ncbi:MAG: PIN domain-containing protein [Lautropia sp.]
MSEFIDTDVWVYAHIDGVDDVRSEQARRLLGDALEPVISTQVLGEYSAVMIRNRMPPAQVRRNLDEMMAMCRTLPVAAATVRRAWALRSRYRFCYRDCQMIAAALDGRCTVLFTGALQHRRSIEGTLQLVDPFLR